MHFGMQFCTPNPRYEMPELGRMSEKGTRTLRRGFQIKALPRIVCAYGLQSGQRIRTPDRAFGQDANTNGQPNRTGLRGRIQRIRIPTTIKNEMTGKLEGMSRSGWRSEATGSALFGWCAPTRVEPAGPPARTTGQWRGVPIAARLQEQEREGEPTWRS